MQVFVWYSKGNEESGTRLAQLLGTNLHGTTPPKGFKGIAVGFGAKPLPEFRWQDRDFRAIFNDPRLIEKTRRNAVVSKEAYDKNTRTRVFVMRDKTTGKFVASSALRIASAEGQPEIVAGKIVGKGINGGNVADQVALLAKLAQDGLVKLNSFVWVSGAATPNEAGAAITAVSKLEGQFYAVDLVTGQGGGLGIKGVKITESPEIIVDTAATDSLVAYIKAFIKDSTRTAKEQLLDLVNGSNDEEAEALLEGLRDMQRKVAR